MGAPFGQKAEKGATDSRVYFASKEGGDASNRQGGQLQRDPGSGKQVGEKINRISSFCEGQIDGWVAFSLPL